MQLIGKSKIGKKRSKPSITYPLIRLPKEYAAMIGRTINIYETKREGYTAFVITFEDEEKNRSTRQVAQPRSEVGQPRPNNATNSRLDALESKTDEIFRFIQANNGFSGSIAKKERPSRDLNPSRSLDRAP